MTHDCVVWSGNGFTQKVHQRHTDGLFDLGFLLLMLLYLWPMLLSEVGWVILIHFSGVCKFSPCKLQYIRNSAARIVP